MVVPVVAGIVHIHAKSGALRRRCGRIHHRLVRQHRPPTRSHKRRIIGLRCFLQRAALKQFAHGDRKLRNQPVFLRDAVAIALGCGIRQGRTRSQRVRRRVRHIRHQQRYLLRGKSRPRQTPALDGGQMFADGIDLRNRRAGKHQRTMRCDQIIERCLDVHRHLHNRRTTAADQKNDQRSCILCVQCLQDRAGRGHRLGVGLGMSSMKISETAHLRGGPDRTRHNALDHAFSHSLNQLPGHGMAGLADRNREHP